MTTTIYYVNELNYSDGYHRFNTHRLPQAYMEQIPLYSVTYETVLDVIVGAGNIIIFQTPTSNELSKLKIIESYLYDNIIFITQESSIFDWFDWPGEEQQLYISILDKCNAFLYHNEYDKNVMKLFTNNFIKYPGCINFSISNTRKFDDGQYVLIPNPIKRYQRGMISHKLVTDVIQNIPIYSMAYEYPKTAYNLSFPDAYRLNGIELIPRQSFDHWLQLINGSRFGVDVHKEFSGGNCALEFGALGVPLVGNINLDIQRDIFPDISFEYNDYDSHKKVIKLLHTDIDFYQSVSTTAIENTKNLYNSTTVVEKFKQEIYKFIKNGF